MICYGDKTFCPFYETCDKQNDCSRPLTPQVKAAAVKWWGGEGAPKNGTANLDGLKK